MSKRFEKRRRTLRDDIASQQDWIKHNGGTRAGYLYHYANTGRSRADVIAIYQADTARLRRLQGELEFLS